MKNALVALQRPRKRPHMAPILMTFSLQHLSHLLQFGDHHYLHFRLRHPEQLWKSIHWKKKFGKQNYLFTTSFLPLNCPSLKICFMKKRSPLDFFKETLIFGAFFRSMAQLWVDINGFWYYRPTKWRKKKSDIRRKHLLIRNFVLLSGTKGWADMQCLC